METVPGLDLVRAVPDTEFRAADDQDGGGLGTLEVRFAPFNSWYEISSWFEGDFMERVVRGAFKKTITESVASIRVQYDHGHDPSIGSKFLGDIVSLEEKSKGPVGTVELFDTSYNRDLLPGLKAGVYGSSYRFRVVKEEWDDDPGVSDHNPKGVPERTVKEVRLYEFGPVAFGANPAATSGVRSMTDAYHERLRARDPQQYEELRAQARALHHPRAAHLGTPGPGGAAPQQDPDEPASRHSGGYSARERRALIYPLLSERKAS
jgi:HK97 family phage prohead protease